MKEIAKKAGVSITTVSHVINKSRQVTTETREAVLKILKDENYHRNRKKNGLSNSRNTIGVIVANIREDFYIAIIKAIETAASENDVSLLLCDSEDDCHKEARNIRSVLQNNIAGLIIAPINSEPIPEELLKTDISVVLLDRNYYNHQFTFVGIDNFRSAMTAAGYLIERGCTNIAFLGYSENIFTVKQRILGCKAAIMESGIAPLQILHLNFNNEDSFSLIKEFFTANTIDGIVCDTSDLCYEAVCVINELGLKVPEDLKIITFDDNKWLDYMKYPVSVVSQPTGEIGTFAVEKIIQMANNPETRRNVKTEVLYDVEIIDRLH